MPSQPVAILASGMVTGGSDAMPPLVARQSDAQSTTLLKPASWIVKVSGSSEVRSSLEHPCRGLGKLVQMVVPAISECLAQVGGVASTSIPLLLCVAERHWMASRMSCTAKSRARLDVRFHPRSASVPQGRIAGAVAIGHARELLYMEDVPLCLIAGVDSLLVSATLSSFEERNRLLTGRELQWIYSWRRRGCHSGCSAARISRATTPLSGDGNRPGRRHCRVRHSTPIRWPGPGP